MVVSSLNQASAADLPRVSLPWALFVKLPIEPLKLILEAARFQDQNAVRQKPEAFRQC
jgi:hypothetical protein